MSGGSNTVIRGTYVHKLLITHIASWASDDFAMKVSEIVSEYYIKEEKDKYEVELTKKKDKIDRMNIKMDTLIKENNKIQNRLDNIYEQNEHLEEQNDDIIYKLDVVTDNRVIPAKHNKNNHSLIIVENRDDPQEYKKKDTLYQFSAIRVANKSITSLLNKHKKYHRHMQMILHIDYSPNSMNLWTRIREKMEQVPDKNKRIECSGRNFNLVNKFTKKELIKEIKQIHNERLNTKDI